MTTVSTEADANLSTPGAERLLRSFDRLFILNLPARSDRLIEIERELSRIGLRIEDPRVTVFPAIRPSEAGAFESVGARGCFLSHLAILREARDAGFHRILILEDDCDFAADFAERAPRVLAELDRSGFDIFYGGYRANTHESGNGPVRTLAPDEAVAYTHFIGFSRRAIVAAIPYLSAMLGRPDGSLLGGPMHVDGAYGWFRAGHPELITRLATPVLGVQRPSRSDISSAGRLDRMPVPESMRRAIRRVLRVAARS